MSRGSDVTVNGLSDMNCAGYTPSLLPHTLYILTMRGWFTLPPAKLEAAAKAAAQTFIISCSNKASTDPFTKLCLLQFKKEKKQIKMNAVQ